MFERARFAYIWNYTGQPCVEPGHDGEKTAASFFRAAAAGVELPSEFRVVALEIDYRAVERRGHELILPP